MTDLELCMRDHDIINTSLAIIRDITGRDYGTDAGLADASVFELGIDSLSIINLIFALEEKLAITIPLSGLDEEMFRSVRNLAAHLSSLRERAAA